MMSSHIANVVMISTCCERWFNAQEEMLALSGTQRHIDGPLCTNKHRNMACFVVCPSQTARQLAIFIDIHAVKGGSMPKRRCLRSLARKGM